MTLDEFIAEYRKDDNIWWRTDCGDHQNYFEDAVEQRDEALAEVDLLYAMLATVAKVALSKKA